PNLLPFPTRRSSDLTKLHGSIDWKFQNKKIIRSLLPFGAKSDHPEIPKEVSEKVVIYPNSSKDIETAFYPYAELFRDFSSAICQDRKSTRLNSSHVK